MTLRMNNREGVTGRETLIGAKSAPGMLREYLDVAIVGVSVFLFHIWHVPAVAAGEIFRKSNLAFDFDIDRFTQLWCTSPFPVNENEDYYAVRHPFAVAVRVMCAPLVNGGLDAHIAACSIAAACAAISSALTFRIAAALDVQRLLAYLLAILWTLSTTSLLLGVLPESYDLAFIALWLQFLLAIRWMHGQTPSVFARGAVAIANFGITITNVVLSGLNEFFCRLAREQTSRALRGTMAFGAAAGSVAIALSVISFLIWPVHNVSNPLDAVKQVYWSAASAERTEMRQSVGDVIWTFGVTAFVAPAADRYPSGLPNNPYLWDVRGQSYSLVGSLAVAGWVVLLALGVLGAVTDRAHWPIWTTASLWIAFNIVLHSYWQFRDSVFLYSAHAHGAFFLLVMAGARWAQERHPQGNLIYAAAITVLIALVGMNNLPLYLDLSRLN